MELKKAIEELKRCAELCPKTPLAAACREGIEALKIIDEVMDRMMKEMLFGKDGENEDNVPGNDH